MELKYLYNILYAQSMKVTISEFRKNLFKLVEGVIAGETVEFVYQGTTVRLVVPEGGASSKLDRLTPRQISNSQISERQHRAAERKLREEMLAEMQKDWTEI